MRHRAGQEPEKAPDINTRDGLAKHLERIVNDKNIGASIRLQAADKLARLRGWLKEGSDKREVMDPTQIMDYLRHCEAAGTDPAKDAASLATIIPGEQN